MAIRVLIVDDAPFVREILRHALQSDEIEIIGEAINGEDAIKIALQSKPNVIILDLVLPSKSGIEVAQEIIEKLPQTRIIACSTLDRQEMIVKAIEAGCCDYITKPFNSEQLLHSIRSSLFQSKENPYG